MKMYQYVQHVQRFARMTIFYVCFAVVFVICYAVLSR